MIFAGEWKRARLGKEHPPLRMGWKVHIEMALCGGAVPEEISVDPQDAIADPKMGRQSAERELVDNPRRSARNRLRPRGRRGEPGRHYRAHKDEASHFSLAARFS